MNKRLIIAAAALTSESLLVYAIFTAIVVAATVRHVLTPFSFAAAAAGGYMLSRLAQRPDWPALFSLAGAPLLSILCISALLQIEYNGSLALDLSPGRIDGHGAEVAGAVAICSVWLRSALRAAGPLDDNDLARSLTAGFALGLVAVVVASATAAKLEIGVAVLSSLALGLFALASNRIQTQSDVAGRKFQKAAMTMPLVLVGLVLAPMVPAWLLATVDPAALVNTPADVLLWLLKWALIITVIPFVFILDIFFGWFFSLLSVEGVEPPSEVLRDIRESDNEPGSVPGWIAFLGKAVLALTIVSIAAAALYFAFRKRWLSHDEREVRESVVVETIRPPAARGWRALLHRFRRQNTEPELPEDVLAVRRLYLAVLSEAATSGVRRADSVTPLEFAPELEACFRSHMATEISEAFIVARYGMAPPTPQEVERLRRLWKERPRH